MKFRKMAADPWAFYRGSACVFYADIGRRAGRPLGRRAHRAGLDPGRPARRELRHLHGRHRPCSSSTSTTSTRPTSGRSTWDLRRFVASLALMCWQKALPDEVIDDLVATYLRAYVDQVQPLRRQRPRPRAGRSRLDTADGCGARRALQQAQLSTRVDLLDRMTVVEDHAAAVPATVPACASWGGASGGGWRRPTRRYLETIPESQAAGQPHLRPSRTSSRRPGFGIGSAGLPAYNLLVEGHTQALENDVVLSMKQGNVAAPSRVVDDEAARRVLRPPRAPDGGVAVRAAGARRPVAAAGPRSAAPATWWPSSRRTSTDLDWSTLSEPGQLRAGGRAAGLRHREGALRQRQGLRGHAAGGLPDRGRRRGSRRRPGRTSWCADLDPVRPRVRRAGARRTTGSSSPPSGPTGCRASARPPAEAEKPAPHPPTERSCDASVTLVRDCRETSDRPRHPRSAD